MFEVGVATKFGFVRDSDKSWQGIDGRPEHVREACDGSSRSQGPMPSRDAAL
jgi:hypothetical protein